MLNQLLHVHDHHVPVAWRADLRAAFERSEYYWARVSRRRDLFTHVEIETNTGCNRKCRICPRSAYEREAGWMSDELYTRILGQLADMGFRGRLSPVFYNEPLLDPRLPRLMREARAALPRSTLVVFTNGSLLTRENVRELLDAGVDTLLVSQYEGNLRADEASYAEATAGLSPAERRRIRYRTLGDDDPLSTSGGLIAVRKPVTRSRCMQASSSCVIDYQGNVVLCCNDYEVEHTFGNVGETPLLDIWNQPRFKTLRRELRHGRFELDICKSCAAGTLAAR